MDKGRCLPFWSPSFRVSEANLHTSNGNLSSTTANNAQVSASPGDTTKTGSVNSTAVKASPSLLDLPLEIIACIFDFLSFEQLSKFRAVCRTFDGIAQSRLNTAFTRVNAELEMEMNTVKHMLPKRESQRRFHPLARVYEIYSVLETRFALLNMTFKRYIEDGACCFIPGKILDEAFCVLRYLKDCVQKKRQPEDAQDLLKDIRDYSSMANEYFDDHIASTLPARDPMSFYCRTKSCFAPAAFPARSPFASVLMSSPDTPSTSRVVYSPFTHNFLEFAKINEWKKNFEEKLKVQEKTIYEQGRVIREQSDAINRMVHCLRKINPELAATCLKNHDSSEDSEVPELCCSKQLGMKRKAPPSNEVEAKKEKKL